LKQFRNLVALVLALALTMTLVGSAMAANDGSIVISGTTSGKYYSAYKIFDMTYSGNAVSYTIDSDWSSFFGTGGAGASYISNTNTTGSLNPIVIGTATKYINITEDNVADFATAALAFATALTPDGRQQATATSLTIGNLPLGYYLVYPEGASGIASGNGSICSLSSTKPTATVNVKAVYPTVDKNILDTEPTKLNEASIGDTVTYQITSTVPDMTGYKWYKMVFDDDLSKGLTFNAITEVKVGNDVLVSSADTEHYTAGTTKKAYTATVGNYDETNGTNIRIALHDLVAAGYTAGTSISIKYTAILNEHANIETSNPNTVDLEYSNNPKWTKDHEPGGPDWGEDEPHGETPDVTTETYTTSVTIHKTDGSAPLSGAAFRISGNGVNVVVTTGEYFEVAATGGTHWKLKDGTYTTNDPNTMEDGHLKYDQDKYETPLTTMYKKVTKVTLDTTGDNAVNAEAFVDSTTGDLTFTGLGVGSYTITETVVPAGYNKAQDVSFNLTFNKDSHTFTSSNANVTPMSGKTNMFETTIVNNSGTTLPTTGGIGTTIFYVAGIVLVLGAAAIIIARRKAEQN